MAEIKAKALSPERRTAVTGSGGKNEAKEPLKGTLDVRVLRGAGEFQVVFHDGKSMKCALVDADNYNILVTWEGKKVLIPKHSVRYVLLGV